MSGLYEKLRELMYKMVRLFLLFHKQFNKLYHLISWNLLIYSVTYKISLFTVLLNIIKFEPLLLFFNFLEIYYLLTLTITVMLWFIISCSGYWYCCVCCVIHNLMKYIHGSVYINYMHWHYIIYVCPLASHI